MFPVVMHKCAYGAYWAQLELILQIPVHAKQEVHGLIEAGFPASIINTLGDLGILDSQSRDLIIPPRMLRWRLARGQRLSVGESDRLFRFVHIMAMAAALFGSIDKSERWLKQPQDRLSVKSPIAMLSTSVGMWQVEELPKQVTDGFASCCSLDGQLAQTPSVS